jgi:putative lipoprotein
MRYVPMILPAALVMSACAATTPDAEMSNRPSAGEVSTGMTIVNVTALYRERIMLAPGHVLNVRIEDVSLADASARMLAEASEPLNGRGPPYAVTLGFPTSQVDPRHTYAARAEIRDASGALVFVTDSRHAVLTNGAPASAEIVLKSAR